MKSNLPLPGERGIVLFPGQLGGTKTVCPRREREQPKFPDPKHEVLENTGTKRSMVGKSFFNGKISLRTWRRRSFFLKTSRKKGNSHHEGGRKGTDPIQWGWAHISGGGPQRLSEF